MIEVLRRLPQLFRALVSLGFGLFWSYVAVTLGPAAGLPTQLGVGAMAIAAILFGVIGLIRATVPSGERIGQTISTPPSDTDDFDADAVFKNYLAHKDAR